MRNIANPDPTARASPRKWRKMKNVYIGERDRRGFHFASRAALNIGTDSECVKRCLAPCGLVRGNTIRARHIGRDLAACLPGVAGGEIREYTKLMAEAREQAVDRMVEEAERLGANAVVGVRFSSSMVMTAASEMLCNGTAMVVEDA